MAARQAVFWARLPKMGLFGPKSAVFGPKIHFLWASSKFFATIMTGHQKDNVFMFIIMPGKLLGGARTCFWPKIGPKIRFFCATPTFSGLRRTRLNGIISPPYPEVTLNTFGFPVGGRLAARRAVSWHILPKMAFFEPQSAVFGPEIIFCGHPPNFLLPS